MRTKPPAAAQVDWSHPLAQGLVYGVPCAEGGGLPRDVAGGVVPVTGGVTPTLPWSVGPLGAQATNAQSLPCYDYGAIAAVTGITVGTVAIWVIPQTTERSDWLTQWSSGPNLHFSLLSGDFAAGLVSFFCSSTGSDSIEARGTTALAVGALALLVGTHDGATIRLYVNAQLDASTALAGGLSTGSTASVRLLSSYDTAANGAAAAAYIWNRPLSVQEIQWLYVEPYALFRPTRPLWAR